MSCRLLLCVLVALGTSVNARPARIMSLNLCADQLLLALAPERVVSVTWLSHTEGDRALAVLARRIPANHGSAEEVLAAHPDLVVAGRYTTGTTRALLKAAGIPLLELEPVADWEGVRRVTRSVAQVIGAEVVGARLLGDMDASLQQLRARVPAQRWRVLGWDGSGENVPGRDTMFNAIVEAAGAINIGAASQGRRRVDLEQVLALAPQVLLRGAASSSKPALRNNAATHRALRSQPQLRMLTYPEAVFSCGVPAAAQQAQQLAELLAPSRTALAP
jgi:iron complex transport system substrate-binding protein